MTRERTKIASIRLTNRSDRRMTLAIEPWATEYPFPPSSTLDVVETGGSEEEAIEVGIETNRVTLYARTAGTMSVFQDGQELTP